MSVVSLLRFLMLFVLLSNSLAWGAQKRRVALPMISFAEVPLYPPIARVANVQGAVHLVVTTDGYRVIAVRLVDGNGVLGAAAQKNAKSWRFTLHKPTSFRVTYVYKLVDDLDPMLNNPRIILRLPKELEIDAERWPRIDTSAKPKP